MAKFNYHLEEAEKIINGTKTGKMSQKNREHAVALQQKLVKQKRHGRFFEVFANRLNAERKA